jgi:hypothetical protein
MKRNAAGRWVKALSTPWLGAAEKSREFGAKHQPMADGRQVESRQ